MIENFCTDELRAILCHAGSWKRFKELLGLDSRQLNRLVAEHGLSLDRLTSYSDEFLRSELHRIGSTTLFCIVTGCKDSELRRRALAAGIDLKQYTTPIGSKIGIGRKGELFFKKLRGELIREDCFETQGHSAPYDFVDADYGLVNVKTAKRSKLTAKTRANDPHYWYFQLEGIDACDFFAFVPLDPTGKPMAVIMAKSQGLRGLKQFRFSGRDLLVSSGNLTPIAPQLLQWIGSIREKVAEAAAGPGAP